MTARSRARRPCGGKRREANGWCEQVNGGALYMDGGTVTFQGGSSITDTSAVRFAQYSRADAL